MKQKTIFLDRDGVINREINYLHKIDDFIFQEGIFHACKYFIEKNYKIIIVTNQSGIYREYYSEEEYKLLTEWMLNKFTQKKISILDVIHCPHGPSSLCECRKPKPGMFNQAREKYNIDMAKSWMIGDKDTDIEAANRAGIKKTILIRGFHNVNELNSKAQFIIDSINQSTKIIK